MSPKKDKKAPQAKGPAEPSTNETPNAVSIAIACNDTFHPAAITKSWNEKTYGAVLAPSYVV